ncbi:MAG: hypothetical protein P9L99_14205 [Candidatus Lernaella stagnicola]|nr:hypothetical protein [Candidatus Lernaella stagnicola]
MGKKKVNEKKRPFAPKVGVKCLVKPQRNREDKPVPLIPYPPRQHGPGGTRYLPKDQFTRVRLDEYLLEIFQQGNLEVMPDGASEAPPAEAAPAEAPTEPEKEMNDGDV